jgi:hypothetical protein
MAPIFPLVKWVLVEVRLGLLVISVVVGIGRWVERRERGLGAAANLFMSGLTCREGV